MNRVIEIIRVFDASVTMSLEYFEKILIRYYVVYVYS